MMNSNKINIAAVITALLAISTMMPGSVDNVVNAQTTCGNLPAGTLPQEGAACTDALADDQATVGCGGESYTGTVRTDLSCTCDRADPIWKCVSTATDIPANKACPAQDTPAASGVSCADQLAVADSSQTCMFSRKFSSSSVTETFYCVCSNAAGSNVDIWSCDGTFAPAVAPTYMPAGQIQPTTTITISKDAEENVDVSDMDITDEETATTTSVSSDDSGASSFITNFKVMVAAMVAVFAASATNF
jgi:hypothetical protein